MTAQTTILQNLREWLRRCKPEDARLRDIINNKIKEAEKDRCPQCGAIVPAIQYECQQCGLGVWFFIIQSLITL